MTNEEIKSHLLHIQSRINMTFRTIQEQEEYEALEMAIKALSQEPKTDKPKANKLCEMCGYRKGDWCIRPKDYICKALSQEPCDDVVSRDAAIEAVKQAIYNHDSAIMRLTELPSVTQKPKYWIDKDNKIYKMSDDIPTMTIQYPTITHGDTISRTEVMKVISDFVTFEKYIDKHNHITFEPLEKMINALPSVTQKSEHFIDGVHAVGYREGYKDAQKQKSGEWIDYSDEGYVECPFCGHATNCEDDIDELHYCFYCGAKMESEDKE